MKAIGRGMKCDKESIVGLAVAFDIFMQKTDEEDMIFYEQILHILEEKI